MSKLLGTGPLTMQNLVQSQQPINTTGKRNYICRRCTTTFTWYKGAKTFPGGTGLCKQHNPNYNE